MINTFIRAIILYILVLIVMRIMGKREIGQFQPFELAIAIMISDLATIPMSDTGIPLSNGIIPITGLLFIHLIITFLNMTSTKIRGVVCGKPSILISKGIIDEKQLKKERFSINELEAKLRDNNVMSITDVEYAILETNGNISVILKTDKQPVTAKDLNIKPEYEGMTYNLVIDGKVSFENLKKIDQSYEWLVKQTQKYHFMPEQALIVNINEAGDIFYQVKDKYKNK